MVLRVGLPFLAIVRTPGGPPSQASGRRRPRRRTRPRASDCFRSSDSFRPGTSVSRLESSASELLSLSDFFSPLESLSLLDPSLLSEVPSRHPTCRRSETSCRRSTPWWPRPSSRVVIAVRLPLGARICPDGLPLAARLLLPSDRLFPSELFSSPDLSSDFFSPPDSFSPSNRLSPRESFVSFPLPDLPELFSSPFGLLLAARALLDVGVLLSRRRTCRPLSPPGFPFAPPSDLFPPSAPPPRPVSPPPPGREDEGDRKTQTASSRTARARTNRARGDGA